MSVNFEFKFKNINPVNNKDPICRIELNSDDIFSGKVEQRIVLDADTQENNVLRIFFENKGNKDTILDDNNKIKQDLNFELEKFFNINFSKFIKITSIIECILITYIFCWNN